MSHLSFDLFHCIYVYCSLHRLYRRLSNPCTLLATTKQLLNRDVVARSNVRQTDASGAVGSQNQVDQTCDAICDVRRTDDVKSGVGQTGGAQSDVALMETNKTDVSQLLARRPIPYQCEAKRSQSVEMDVSVHLHSVTCF